MLAAVQETYGPPEVLSIAEVARPTCGSGQVLIRVHASPVTYGDRRLRSADFPSFTAIPGRLLLGVSGPRNRIPGTAFAGRVVEVGADVTAFAVGDDVFGYAGHGACAEYLAVAADGPLVALPAGMSHEAAAELPYSAITALVHLRDLGRVQPGERVLVIGAAGGVGRMAVQIASHLGAEVTAVCRTSDAERVRGLGATHVRALDEVGQAAGVYDVVFDTPGATTFGQARAWLAPGGRYLFLVVTVTLLLQALWTSVWGDRRVRFAVSLPTRANLEAVRELAARGVLRSEVERSFPLARIVEAHRHAEGGGVRGVVSVRMGDPIPA